MTDSTATTAPPQPLREVFATNLRTELARRRITQAALAEQIGSSLAWIQRRVGGDSPSTLEDVEKIADALGVPAVRLLTEQE